MPQGSVASGGKVDIIHPALRSHVDPRLVSLMILTNLRLRDSNRQFLAGPSLRYIRAYMSTSSSRTTVLSTERPHRWNPKFDLDLSPTIIILRYPRLFCASYESNHGSDSYEKKKITLWQSRTIVPAIRPNHQTTMSAQRFFPSGQPLTHSSRRR